MAQTTMKCLTAFGLTTLLAACSYYTFDPEKNVRQHTRQPASRYVMRITDTKNNNSATFDVRVAVNTATFSNVQPHGIDVIDFIAKACPQLGQPVGNRNTLLMQPYDNKFSLIGNQFSRHVFYATELATDALTPDRHIVMKFSEQIPITCDIVFAELRPKTEEQRSPHHHGM